MRDPGTSYGIMLAQLNGQQHLQQLGQPRQITLVSRVEHARILGVSHS